MLDEITFLMAFAWMRRKLIFNLYRRIRANPVWYAEIAINECLVAESKDATKFWHEHRKRDEIQKTSEFIRTELQKSDHLDEFVDFISECLID